jgi:glucosylceramidase
MIISHLMLPAAVLLVGLQACTNKSDTSGQDDAPQSEVSLWVTAPDQSKLLSRQDVVLNFLPNTPSGEDIIEIDDNQKYQTIDGFGYTLTGGSAELINALPSPQKEQLIREIFSNKGDGIGSNYLRITVGASDLSSSLFTYNEVPEGETDMSLAGFSLEPEQKDLIPVLKMIRAVNPEIKIMASPWTAPTWMKDNRSYIGGRLKPEYYEVYANYLVRYIQAMASEGIPIDALTPQNEPLHPGNNPSMYMEATEQANFIKKALGPAFREAGIKTKIVIYDHNADRPDYPISILNDPEARQYIDGSAFHLYGGKIEALSEVHEAHPDRNIYFTEQWVGGPQNFGEELSWHIENLIVGATRNWSRTVLEWNLAADQNYDPHTDQGGCDRCLGALTINGSVVTRNVAYYIIGHASKFVPTGSQRIASSEAEGLPNVAFITPEGEKVLIVLNKSGSAKDFTISYDGKTVQSSLAKGEVATYVW